MKSWRRTSSAMMNFIQMLKDALFGFRFSVDEQVVRHRKNIRVG